MNQIYITLFLLLATIVVLMSNKIKNEIVALGVFIAFYLTGILTVPEILQGFSDPNIIMIALLFIIGSGIVRTGIAYRFSESLIFLSKNNETKVLIFLMIFVAFIGAFMSSTGIVAIFIPVTLLICQKMNINPRNLMMPLSMAGLISGMMTLIATPPNLVANAELIKRTGLELKFFDFTLIGLTILIVGIVYNLTIGRYLLQSKQSFKSHNEKEQNYDEQDQAQNKTEGKDRTITNLIQNYDLNHKLKRFVVKKGSKLIGKRIEELKLRLNYQVNVLTIERWKSFQPIFINAVGKTEIREKDILLIDILNEDGFDLNTFENEFNLEQGNIKENHFSEQAKNIGLIEVLISPESDFLNKTAKQLKLRNQFHFNLLAIKRNNEIIKNNISDEEIKEGDILLIVSDWKSLDLLRNNSQHFLMLSYPSDINKAIPVSDKMPHAILSLIIMILLMVFNIVPNIFAIIIGILLFALFKCIDLKSSYESIHWSSLLLIIGMIPFSVALQKTGGITLLIENIYPLIKDAHLYCVLGALFILTSFIGLFISNTATAILLSPVAIELAQKLELNPIHLIMIVAISASSAFMTPVSSPVNTMVVNAGNYSFSDFLKVGIPFTIIVGLISVFMVPVVF